MKKLFAFASALVMSASMFAALSPAPTDDALNALKQGDNNLVYAIYVDDAIKCDDIILVGTYNNWGKRTGTSENPDSCAKFAAVEGFDGWYAVAVTDATAATADGGIQAKPIQLNGNGGFSWDYQIGKDAALVRGTASLESGNNGTEVDIKSIDATKPLLIEVKSWKNNPCTAVYHNYTVTLVSPDCNPDDYVVPAISGGFNNWAQEAMILDDKATAERQQANKPGAVFTATFKAAEGSDFKFRSDSVWGTAWTNELKQYNDSDDVWEAFNGGKNIVLGTELTLSYDLGDTAKYMWSNCEKAAPVVTKNYELTFTNIPVCDSAVLAVVGGWAACDWKLPNAVEVPASGVVTITAKNSDEFKLLDKTTGDWNNEVKGFNQTTFGALDKDEDGKIAIDLAGTYFANCAPQAVENVEVVKNVRKVIENGQMIIIVDGVRYNVTGAKL